MPFTFANAARTGSPRELKCSGTGTTPKLGQAFVKKVNAALEYNIVEVEADEFSQSFVPLAPVRYSARKYSGVETKLDGLVVCRDENGMYSTLVG